MNNITHAIHHDLMIDAPIEKVYKAISYPADLINWWPQQCSGTPKEGAEYNFQFGPEYNWYGVVEKSIPNQSFHIKMTQSDEDWNPTSFGFELHEKKNKIALSFSHRNWAECNEHFRISSFCWAMLLNGLKNYAERGEIVPFEKRS